MTSTDSQFALGHGQRGLVVSTRVMEGKPGTWRIYRTLDPQDLRWALLFWDKIAWPTAYVPQHVDEADEAAMRYLETAKVLVRPDYPGAARLSPEPHPLLGDRVSGVYSDLPSRHLRERINSLGGRIPEDSALPSPVLSNALRHLLAFLEADAVKRGAWALANDLSPMLEDATEQSPPTRGMLVNLFNCIPVPDETVPLPDILQFREKRNDQLLELRTEVEGLYVGLHGDTHQALLAAKERMDRACADAIRVARESRLQFRLSAVKAGFTLPLGAVAGDMMIKGWLDQPIGMPAAGALLAGVASTFALSWDIVPRAVQPRNLPYRYIVSMHRELI